MYWVLVVGNTHRPCTAQHSTKASCHRLRNTNHSSLHGTIENHSSPLQVGLSTVEASGRLACRRIEVGQQAAIRISCTDSRDTSAARRHVQFQSILCFGLRLPTCLPAHHQQLPFQVGSLRPVPFALTRHCIANSQSALTLSSLPFRPSARTTS